MKVAVLFSGGVDSSVALYRLVKQGHDVTAFYLKIWLEDDLQFLGECPWEEDLLYARRVCQQLDVPLKVVSLQTAYWERVVAHTIVELKKGRTPSPDILCNQRVKFGAFRDLVGAGYDKIASGHYAGVEQRGEFYHLLQSPDPVKDQTYFLSHLNQEQLGRCLFPLGDLTKAQVRQLADEAGLATCNRKDSQGICFLGKIKYSDFVRCHLGELSGAIREWETKRVLGTHKGYWFHTIGQRKGLGLSGGPWFVVKKDIETNTVYVSTCATNESMARTNFYLESVNWMVREPETADLFIKVRHGPNLVACRIEPVKAGVLHVAMAKPDKGIADGQYGVLYHQGECLGGGIISNL